MSSIGGKGTLISAYQRKIATNMIVDVSRSDDDQQIVEYSATFPTMASINRYVLRNLTPAHLLYAQEKYLARVQQYESSCKGKIKSSRLCNISKVIPNFQLPQN